MLKRIRVFVAILVLTGISFYFIDFTGWMSNHIHWLAKVQLIPALLALNIGVILFLVLLTFLFGRVYCSTLCPMGIFQDVFTRLSLIFRKKKKKKFKYRAPQNKLRYLLLGLTVIALVAGYTVVAAALEPYSAYGRIVTHIFKPGYLAGNNLLASMSQSSGTYRFLQTEIVLQSVFSLVMAIVTLLIVGFLSWRYGRIYCNTVCPAGTLLGMLSKHARMKININTELCNSCGLCERSCKASCINSKGKTIDNSRCVDCYNCLSQCKRGAISYSFSRKAQKEVTEPVVNDSRRQFIATTIATTVVAPIALAQEKKNEAATLLTNQKSYKKQHAIAPPGSRGHKHLSTHCTSCHLCVNRCPSNILKPSLLEYGWTGVMQPVISFDNGFCEPECTVCSDVCPNGAIKPLTVDRKQRTQIGHAVFVAENCIVNSQQISCGACSRKCPMQAITMVATSGGLQVPSIDTQKCIGCGACEYICPVQPYRGIYVEGNTVHTNI